MQGGRRLATLAVASLFSNGIDGQVMSGKTERK
jgi:hypothetical protein